jgi:hypothetical protein
MYEGVSLGSILEKKKDTQDYTNDARLYQDILNFCLSQDRNGMQNFKHTEIAKWLLNNNQEFLDFYSGTKAHTKMSSRIENTQQRIKNKLVDLSKMDLIRIGETEQQKGSGTTNLYKITPFAILFGTIMDSIRAADEESKKSADKRLYELFIKQFTRYLNSLNQFRSKLYAKLMSADLFTDFIANGLRKILLSADPPRSMHDLLQRLILISQFDEKLQDRVELYLKLWFESLAELDHETKNLFLFNIKVEIENQIMTRSDGPKTYEKMRFYNRDDYQSIVLEGICNNCFHVQPRVIDIESYLKLYMGSAGKPLTLFKCVNCTEGIVILTNI